jgi:hypothetical protein
MGEMAGPLSAIPEPRDLSERLELANRLYREYHTRCFWHCPRDLEITEQLVPFVIKGLRTHGGHLGFLLASKLRGSQAPSAPGEEGTECP